jgi:hypothetical protein
MRVVGHGAPCAHPVVLPPVLPSESSLKVPNRQSVGEGTWQVKSLQSSAKERLRGVIAAGAVQSPKSFPSRVVALRAEPPTLPYPPKPSSCRVRPSLLSSSPKRASRPPIVASSLGRHSIRWSKSADPRSWYALSSAAAGGGCPNGGY